MKNLALKVKKRDESSSKNEESDDEEDLFCLITRGLEGIMRMTKRFKRYKLRNDYKGISSSNSNFKSNKLTCFECGSNKHFVKECPKKKNKHRRRTKRNKQWLLSGVTPRDQVSRKTRMNKLIYVLWLIALKRMMKKTTLRRY